MERFLFPMKWKILIYDSFSIFTPCAFMTRFTLLSRAPILASARGSSPPSNIIASLVTSSPCASLVVIDKPPSSKSIFLAKRKIPFPVLILSPSPLIAPSKVSSLPSPGIISKIVSDTVWTRPEPKVTLPVNFNNAPD